MPELEPDTSYVICFYTLVGTGSGGGGGDNQEGVDNGDSSVCKELKTLPAAPLVNNLNSGNFPVTEVATASVLASLATAAVIVALICCCCSACLPKGGGAATAAASRFCGDGCCQLGTKRTKHKDSEDRINSKDENDNKMKHKDNEAEPAQSINKIGAESQVELNVDDTDDDDNEGEDEDNEDGYSHFKSTSVISVIENKTEQSVDEGSIEDGGAADQGSSVGVTFQDRYTTATLPRSSSDKKSMSKLEKQTQLVPLRDAQKPSQSASSSSTKRRFWQNCLSTASSSPSENGAEGNNQNSANSRYSYRSTVTFQIS
jgi:hypothetical protein